MELSCRRLSAKIVFGVQAHSTLPFWFYQSVRTWGWDNKNLRCTVSLKMATGCCYEVQWKCGALIDLRNTIRLSSLFCVFLSYWYLKSDVSLKVGSTALLLPLVSVVLQETDTATYEEIGCTGLILQLFMFYVILQLSGGSGISGVICHFYQGTKTKSSGQHDAQGVRLSVCKKVKRGPCTFVQCCVP